MHEALSTHMHVKQAVASKQQPVKTSLKPWLENQAFKNYVRKYTIKTIMQPFCTKQIWKIFIPSVPELQKGGVFT